MEDVTAERSNNEEGMKKLKLEVKILKEKLTEAGLERIDLKNGKRKLVEEVEVFHLSLYLSLSLSLSLFISLYLFVSLSRSISFDISCLFRYNFNPYPTMPLFALYAQSKVEYIYFPFWLILLVKKLDLFFFFILFFLYIFLLHYFYCGVGITRSNSGNKRSHSTNRSGVER